MINIMVDVEADGPVPGLFSMTEIGAIVVEPQLNRTFYGKFSPISPNSNPEALAVTGFTREEIETWPDPKKTMMGFDTWLNRISNGGQERIIFWSDNNGFDWAYVNYYFHAFLGKNPFGHSSNNLRNLYNGLQKSMSASYRDLRKTRHTHNPVDDARGNAEALLRIQEMMKAK